MKYFLLSSVLLLFALESYSQNFKYGASFSYGMQSMKNKVVETSFDPDQNGGTRGWDYMRLRSSEGAVYSIQGYVRYFPLKLIGVESGFDLIDITGNYKPAIENQQQETYQNFYFGLPLKMYLFPKSNIRFYGGFTCYLRLSSKSLNQNLNYFEQAFQRTENLFIDMELKRFDLQYNLGFAIALWKAELSICYFESITPFLTTFSPKPKVLDFEGDYYGKYDFYYSGFKLNLSIPLGSYEFKKK